LKRTPPFRRRNPESADRIEEMITPADTDKDIHTLRKEFSAQRKENRNPPAPEK
jgi:hypothetical protein